jgi:hypothetical protein
VAETGANQRADDGKDIGGKRDGNNRVTRERWRNG